jgi:hypothetical protein
MKVFGRFCLFTFVPLIIYLLSGCVPSGIYLPDNFSSIHEVYPSADAIDQVSGAPDSAFRKAVYAVPYGDVFRTAEVTATQLMMTIETLDEDSGIILAYSIVPEPQPFEQTQVCMGLKNEVRYYYAIKIRETGPATTEVTLVSKAQGRCCYPGGTTVGGTVGSLMGVPFDEWQAMCEDFASVHYSTKQEDVLQYFNFMRLNLMNAGLI